MHQNRRMRPTERDCFFSSCRVPINQEKKKNSEEEMEREIHAGLTALQEPLAQLARETEELLADLKTPPLSFFRNLVRNTIVTGEKVTWREIFSFCLIALSFLTLIGYLLHRGYLLPVVGFFATATLLLPTAVLFADEN